MGIDEIKKRDIVLTVNDTGVISGFPSFLCPLVVDIFKRQK